MVLLAPELEQYASSALTASSWAEQKQALRHLSPQFDHRQTSRRPPNGAYVWRALLHYNTLIMEHEDYDWPPVSLAQDQHHR